MKLLQPDIPRSLRSITDLAALLHRDEALSGLAIDHQDITGITAKSAVLNESKVVTCSFAQAKIEKLQVRDCTFEHCDFTACVLADSSWHAVEISESRCSGMQMQTSALKNVVFKNSKVDFTNFRYAHLENIIFENCTLTELDLYSAALKNVSFIRCTIDNVEFSEAKLQNVDLSSAYIVNLKGIRSLRGAHISPEQLLQLAPYFAQELGILVND